MKKLSAVLLIIIFCCTSVAFPNAKKPKFKVSITLKQGKPIAKGNDAGKIGYQSTSYETKGNNTTIICSGNGIVVCPKPLISKVLQKNNDKIAEKIHRA
ncbi:MAG: hypothetical protein LBH82_02815, partial [Bacteroidales bacterium]|nr:hypothetical protein [Bacteroidales bacterium]